jgi:hypothetical protein
MYRTTADLATFIVLSRIRETFVFSRIRESPRYTFACFGLRRLVPLAR